MIPSRRCGRSSRPSRVTPRGRTAAEAADPADVHPWRTGGGHRTRMPVATPHVGGGRQRDDAMHTIIMLVVLAVILVVTGRTDDFDRGYEAGLEGRHDAAAAYYTKSLREGDLSRENRARALNNRAIASLRMGQQIGRASCRERVCQYV